MDPSLSSGTITLPSLVSGDSGSGSGCPAKQAAVVVTEGLPPVSTKFLEKIQNWEFVELANLLSHENPSGSESLSIIKDGHSMIVRPQNEPASRKRITDLSTWLQAFSICATPLAASDKSNSAQFKGLMAHMYLMIQLSKDLGGTAWLQYNREFRTWAAAKGVKIWVELNLSIYGHWLAAHQRPPTFSNLSPRSVAMIIGMTRNRPKVVSKIAGIYGTLMVPASNLPQHAAISMHAILVVKITGQWIKYPCPASKSMKGY